MKIDKDILGIILNVLCLFIGGLITYLVSRHFYISAAEDLEKKAEELKRNSEFLLFGMEKMGWVQLNRDTQGKILNFNFVLDVQDSKHALTSDSPTLVDAKENKKTQY